MREAEGKCPGGTQARPGTVKLVLGVGVGGRGSQGFSNGRMLICWPLN